MLKSLLSVVNCKNSLAKICLESSKRKSPLQRTYLFSSVAIENSINSPVTVPNNLNTNVVKKATKAEKAHTELVKTFQNIIGEKTKYKDSHGVSSDLYKKQLFFEEEQQNEAIKEYLESLASMVGMDRGTSSKGVQRVLLRWYEPLTELIQEECNSIKSDMKGVDRKVPSGIWLD